MDMAPVGLGAFHRVAASHPAPGDGDLVAGVSLSHCLVASLVVCYWAKCLTMASVVALAGASVVTAFSKTRFRFPFAPQLYCLSGSRYDYVA